MPSNVTSSELTTIEGIIVEFEPETIFRFLTVTSSFDILIIL